MKLNTCNKTRTHYTVHIEDKYTVHIQNTNLLLGIISTQYIFEDKYIKEETKYTVHIEIKTQNKLNLVHSTHSE